MTSNSTEPNHQTNKLPAARKGDQLWSSLAASSALVSETVLDSWPAESNFQATVNPHTPSQMRDDAERRSGMNSVRSSTDRLSPFLNDDFKGVNHHNYSPESLRRILDQQHQEKVINAQHHPNVLCDEFDANDCNVAGPNIIASPIIGAASFVSRWVQVQRIKRQKEALEKAVEEQRRILLRQTLCTERKRKEVRTKKSKEDHSEIGLSANETFQNMTRVRTKRTVSGLSFCGGGSSEYVDDDDYDSTFDEESSQCTDDNDVSGKNSSCPDELTFGIEDDSAVSYDSSLHQDEDTFMIGNPSHSVSGQGMALQLQILEKPHRKQKPGFLDDESQVKIIHERSSVPFILSPAQMKEIAQNGLPASIMFARWKRLYCLQRDGDSFNSSFLKKVSGEIRTLLVIETTNHEMMGGYSNSPWENQGGSVGAAFYGSCQASLFKINKRDGRAEVFKWSGCNRYVQVCDVHAKLLAFGGGGKDGSFGLCVEDDFAVGTTGRCETFNNDPLCDEGRFEILNVECWGFMPDF